MNDPFPLDITTPFLLHALSSSLDAIYNAEEQVKVC